MRVPCVRMRLAPAVLALVACVPPATGDPRTATAQAWEAAVVVGEVPAGTVLRAPFLGIGDTVAYLTGNTLPANAQAALSGTTVFLLRVGAGRIEAPPGAFVFAYPKGVVTPDGAYHLIWAEPDRAPNSSLEFVTQMRLTALWHARFDGQSWSSPVRIREAKSIPWEEGSVRV